MPQNKFSCQNLRFRSFSPYSWRVSSLPLTGGGLVFFSKIVMKNYSLHIKESHQEFSVLLGTDGLVLGLLSLFGEFGLLTWGLSLFHETLVRHFFLSLRMAG